MLPGLATPRPFADFIEFSLAHPQIDSDEFWKEYLKEYETPASFNGPDSSTAKMALSERDIIFSAEESATIMDFARKSRLSINTLVHAAWSLLLMTYAGRDDVVYGATFSGREPRLQGVEKMIGVFINTLPVRVTRVAGQLTREWLQVLQNNLNRLKDHELSALARIKRCSELDARAGLFDCLLVVENYPDAPCRSRKREFEQPPWHAGLQPYHPYRTKQLPLCAIDAARFTTAVTDHLRCKPL